MAIEIVDLPIQHGGFHNYVSLPEATLMELLSPKNSPV